MFYFGYFFDIIFTKFFLKLNNGKRIQIEKDFQKIKNTKKYYTSFNKKITKIKKKHTTYAYDKKNFKNSKKFKTK